MYEAVGFGGCTFSGNLSGLASCLGSLCYQECYWERFLEQEGLKGFRATIRGIDDELKLTEGMLNHPAPGQGLESLCLHVVNPRFQELKNWIIEYGHLGEKLLTSSNDDQKWLARDGFKYVCGVCYAKEYDFHGVVESHGPASQMLNLLNDEAKDWAVSFNELSAQQKSEWRQRDVLERLADDDPWIQPHKSHESKCNYLLLQAIDQCEVSKDKMVDIVFPKAVLTGLASNKSPVFEKLLGNSYTPNDVCQYVAMLVDTAAKKDSFDDKGNRTINASGFKAPNPSESSSGAPVESNEKPEAQGGATLPLGKIPAERRTRIMSKKEAVSYLRNGNSGSAVEWMTKCIKDGTISCESLSRQSHVFDTKNFPKKAHIKICLLTRICG